MILHVLRFRFNDHATDTDVSACLDAFREVGRADSVAFSLVGQYAGKESDNYTHSAVYAVADIHAFERYMSEPAHREADFIVHPHVTNFDAFDVGESAGADLAARIAQVQQRRIADDPELAKLMEEQWN